MNLLDVVKRSPPRPWIDGEKIPWDEQSFSQRMLVEHLSQAHNAASRRFALIEQHVEWIRQHLLPDRAARILDLGCGPGLYLNRLAHYGHSGVGIDFSPASIVYARAEARRANLPVTYRQEDLRTALFTGASDSGFDLAMLLFGEFNTFRPADAQMILDKAYSALRAGGRLLLEPSTLAAVQAMGEQPAGWYTADTGLWSNQPHLCLQDSAWDAQQCAAAERFIIIDAATGTIVQHGMTTKAYREDEIGLMFRNSGFMQPVFYPSLLGHAHPDHSDFYAVAAQKPG